MAGEHALHDVGAVETVHTVCADDATLPAADSAGGAGAGGVEVALGFEAVGELVEEELHAVPAHRTAFVVEVKVDVVETVCLPVVALGLDDVESL